MDTGLWRWSWKKPSG